ncbi:uncharacterized protein LOC142592792 [Dermacentor variabilis]|uniref:uncharacterized protein LOC142592792 n=1 Tax=Dermacentor variabilis TaxID=34621 RepID=UPI003F5C155F
MEPVARKDFEQQRGVKVTEVGLLLHPQQPWLCGSPDGIFSLSGETCLLEIKCPHKCIDRGIFDDSGHSILDYVHHVDGNPILRKSHRLPAVPESVPGSPRRTPPPATARGVSTAVTTLPGGAPTPTSSARPPRALGPGACTTQPTTPPATPVLECRTPLRRRLRDPHHATYAPNQM